MPDTIPTSSLPAVDLDAFRAWPGPDECLFGWASPRACNYSGGCFCDHLLGHPGRCHCGDCGSTKQRPSDWDAVGRAKANQ